MNFFSKVGLVFSCLAAVAGAASLSRGSEISPIPDDHVAAWTQKRIVDWQPKPSERRFDEIGWAKDIRTARQLAVKSQRPVFIFTMDGRINIGRC